MGRRRNRKRMRQGLNSVDWTYLPTGVLEVVFQKLNLIDCISVSDVCKAWRSVVCQELSGWERRGIPWLMMSGQKERVIWKCRSILQKQRWKVHLPSARGRYCWGSHDDWLFLVKVFGFFRLEINLFNPFSRKKTDLPETRDFYCKMLLSGNPSFGNFICMLVHSQCRELAFWVPGVQSWLKLKLDGERFLDAVFSKGRFYLVSNDCNILEIEDTDVLAAVKTDNADEIKTRCHEVKMLEEQEQNQENVLKYLVESCGEILLVCRFYKPKTEAICESQDFKVYSLDFSKKFWKRVHDLGDQILFLGKSCSRSLSSRELGAQTKNCIYFSNNDVDPSWNEWDSDKVCGKSTGGVQNNPDIKDWGVFRLTRNENDERFRFRGNIYRWGPVWFTAPQWWCCRNLRLGR